jgi:DNA-binding beta-propeller fold protein YncE
MNRYILAGLVLFSLCTTVNTQNRPYDPDQLWLLSGTQAWFLGGSEAETYDAGDEPSAIALSPDGQKVAIASMGKLDPIMSMNRIVGWKQKKGSQSTVAIFSRSDNKAIARHVVQFRPIALAFSKDAERLTVASLGQFDSKPKNAIPVEIVHMIATSGDAKSRTTAAAWTNMRWFTPSAARLMLPVVNRSEEGKLFAELLSVDTDTGDVRRFPLSSSARSWSQLPDDSMRYLLLNRGMVKVSARGELIGSPIEAGEENAGLIATPDGSRLFLASETKKQKQGFVSLIAGDALKTVKLPMPRTMALDESGKRLFYVAEREVITLDAGTLDEIGRSALSVSAAMEARLDPSETRLYVNAYGGKVAVIDVVKGLEIGAFSAGRGAVKFGMALAAAASDALQSMQYRYYQPKPPTTLTEIKTLAFGPSGKFVFVYNSLSADITVVDAETLTVLTKEPTGPVDRAQFIWQTQDGLHLVVNGEKRLLVFNTETGKIVGRQDVKQGHVRFAPEFGRVLTTTSEKTTVAEVATFHQLAELPAADDVVFIPEANRFALVSATAVRLYDFDLKAHAVAAGQFKPSEIFRSHFHFVSPGK